MGSKIPSVAEVSRNRKNYTTLHNILLSKKCGEVGANKKRVGSGIKRKYGDSPPHSHL